MALRAVSTAGWLKTVNDNFSDLEAYIAGETYYVDLNNGDDGNGGDSWESAWGTLSVALAVSHAAIAANAWGWTARNRIFVKADQTADAEGEDLTALAQKTDIIGVGSVDHLLGARIIGNHAIDTTSYMGCRFINMIFKCPAAGGDIFTLPTEQSGIAFLGCTFDAQSTTKCGGAIIATAVESLTIQGCTFMGQFSDAVIEIGAGASNSLLIADNIIEGANNGVEINASATCAARAGRVLRNTINTTAICITDGSGKFYVHNNDCVTGNATGAAGAGGIVAGAKMMLGNKLCGSDNVNCNVPALGTLQ